MLQGSTWGQAEGGDDNWQQGRDDVPTVCDLARRQHAQTLPECEPVTQVDGGALRQKPTLKRNEILSPPRCASHRDSSKPDHQALAHFKGMHRADAAQQLLGIGIGLDVLFEHFGLVAGIDKGHDGHEDDG
ncbi:uncharacterized protein PgNI_12031 [Pyricularia grisea]|uniref:Uncharacterized protein n=1 Tax=Pyricularia grisea TaxID=148305 RepID=A0A6P8AQH9_PYRGI|nr:uncharacterized protein PgNI_12031 [Pyricularia grisea]TLD04325.1 hypothetical protein PgNI_12031 [Pyricularia grisea]